MKISVYSGGTHISTAHDCSVADYVATLQSPVAASWVSVLEDEQAGQVGTHYLYPPYLATAGWGYAWGDNFQ